MARTHHRSEQEHAPSARPPFWRLVRAAAATAGVVLVVLGLTSGDATHEVVLLVLGLIVLLVALVTDLVAQAMHRARTNRKRCPMCAERIQAAARVCRHCGHGLEDA